MSEALLIAAGHGRGATQGAAWTGGAGGRDASGELQRVIAAGHGRGEARVPVPL